MQIKRAFLATGAAAALALTGGVAADVATSHNTSQAQAYNYVAGPVKWQADYYWNGYRYMCGVWANIDYNWLEELQGQRDGWKRLYWAYC